MDVMPMTDATEAVGSLGMAIAAIPISEAMTAVEKPTLGPMRT